MISNDGMNPPDAEGIDFETDDTADKDDLEMPPVNFGTFIPERFPVTDDGADSSSDEQVPSLGDLVGDDTVEFEIIPAISESEAFSEEKDVTTCRLDNESYTRERSYITELAVCLCSMTVVLLYLVLSEIHDRRNAESQTIETTEFGYDYEELVEEREYLLNRYWAEAEELDYYAPTTLMYDELLEEVFFLEQTVADKDTAIMSMVSEIARLETVEIELSERVRKNDQVQALNAVALSQLMLQLRSANAEVDVIEELERVTEASKRLTQRRTRPPHIDLNAFVGTEIQRRLTEEERRRIARSIQ